MTTDLFGMPKGIPCCCLAGCCSDTVLPDCITLELESSCCPGDVATVVLTKDDAIDACYGGEKRPSTAADGFCSTTPEIVYTGALDASWCAAAELSNGTVLVFCCVDPITGEKSWWIYFSDSDPSHTWYPSSTSQFYRMILVSCSPFLLQFGSDYTCSTPNCIYTMGATCFIGGTLIETPTGAVDIVTLKKGDIVLDVNNLPVSVKSVIITEVDVMIRLTGNDGLDTGVTPEHPFLDLDLETIVQAGDLVVGKQLPFGKSIVRTKIEKGKFTVYNLSVTGSNTFIADGFAVHNKGQ